MHLTSTGNRNGLCEMVTTLTGISQEEVHDIHLFQTYILFDFIKHATGSELLEQYQNIPHELFDTIEAPQNFFIHYQTLPDYRAQIITNKFQEYTLDRFLAHIAPSLMKNVSSGLSQIRRHHSYSPHRLAIEVLAIARCVADHTQARLLQKKKGETTSKQVSIYDLYLSKMGHYDDHLNESTVNSVADHINSYVLPVHQLSIHGTRGVKATYRPGKKIFDLLRPHRISNLTHLMLLDEFIETGTIDIENLQYNHGIYTIDPLVLKELFNAYKGIISNNIPIEGSFINYIIYCLYGSQCK